MQTFGYDLLLIAIDAIIASLVSILLTKALSRKTENQVCNIDRDAVCNTIILVPMSIEKDSQKPSSLDKSRNQTNSHANNVSIAAMLLIAFLAVYCYLRYESQITIGIIALFTVLESFCLTTAYLAFRKYSMSRDTKKRVIFNLVASCMALIVLMLQRYPIYGAQVDKVVWLEALQNDGIVGMIVGGDDCLYLMAQAAGLILLVFYMLQILKGALHILALINLALGNRMTKTWIYVWKFTDTDCRKLAQYFKVSIMLMLLSIFLVSGIFIEFVLSFANAQ